MRNDKEWGTVMEVLSAVKLLNCDIYMYQENRKNGQREIRWIRYETREKPGCDAPNRIYIKNPYNVHYDVVLRV